MFQLPQERPYFVEIVEILAVCPWSQMEGNKTKKLDSLSGMNITHLVRNWTIWPPPFTLHACVLHYQNLNDNWNTCMIEWKKNQWASQCCMWDIWITSYRSCFCDIKSNLIKILSWFTGNILCHTYTCVVYMLYQYEEMYPVIPWFAWISGFHKYDHSTCTVYDKFLGANSEF